MVPSLNSDHLKSFQALVPSVLAAIRELVLVDEVCLISLFRFM